MEDSNLRRRKPTDLQSVPFGHFGNCPWVGVRCSEYPPCGNAPRIIARNPSLCQGCADEQSERNDEAAHVRCGHAELISANVHSLLIWPLPSTAAADPLNAARRADGEQRTDAADAQNAPRTADAQHATTAADAEDAAGAANAQDAAAAQQAPDTQHTERAAHAEKAPPAAVTQSTGRREIASRPSCGRRVLASHGLSPFHNCHLDLVDCHLAFFAFYRRSAGVRQSSREQARDTCARAPMARAACPTRTLTQWLGRRHA